MKRNIFIMAVVFLFSFSVVHAGTLVKKVYFSTFPIVIDGEEYSSESPILSYQNRTYVSLREFSEMIGVKIDFKNDTIIISTEDDVVKDDFNKNEIDDTNLLDVLVNLDSNASKGENNTQYEDKIVYISKTGSKYHALSKCNGGNYNSIALNEAIKKGYTPCKRCVTLK